MAASTVGINSTFEQQRLVINQISEDLDSLLQNPVFPEITIQGNSNISGVTTSVNGFTSGIGVTNPVKITVTGNVLTFNIVGVGSTSLILY